MSIPDFTVVLGIDDKHLDQLAWVWPTWRRYKPSTFDRPVIVFYDKASVTKRKIIDLLGTSINLVAWPPDGVVFSGDGSDKWNNPQRHKMLTGFVYAAARFVETPYFLKLDTDVVAIGNDDWIKSEWFDGSPTIISHKWGFSRPPDLMVRLDDWVAQHKNKLPELAIKKPLNLVPLEGWDRVCHKRINSWCGFFDTRFNCRAAEWATLTCGQYQLPVASQDSYLWYVAERLGLKVVYLNMKKNTGWQQWSTFENVRKYSEEAMK